MIQAPVGHHCPTCVHEGAAAMRRRPGFSRPAGRGGAAWAPPGRLGPVVTALVAANLAVFVAGLAGGDLVGRFADNAVLVAAGQWYRMVTAAFLHAGLVHLGFNMVGLAVFGSQVEAALGSAPFLALYLVAAAGGSAASHFVGAPGSYGVGASGAVFGVFGAHVVVARARGLDAGQVGGLIVVNLLLGAALPGIDNAAHLGGLATGAALALGHEQAGRLGGARSAGARVATVVLVAAVVAGAAAVRSQQLRGRL